MEQLNGKLLTFKVADIRNGHCSFHVEKIMIAYIRADEKAGIRLQRIGNQKAT